jgi:hypothetical protein
MKTLFMLLSIFIQCVTAEDVPLSRVCKIEHQLSDKESFSQKFGFQFSLLNLKKEEYVEKIISSKNMQVSLFLINASVQGGSEFSRCVAYNKNNKDVIELPYIKDDENWISDVFAVNARATKAVIEIANVVNLSNGEFFVKYSTVIYSIEKSKLSDVSVEDLLCNE